MRKSKIGFLLVMIFICLGFTKALANPPSGTLANTVNTLTINGNFWCGYTQTGMPPPSGNYILTIDWTDLGGNPVNYETPSPFASVRDFTKRSLNSHSVTQGLRCNVI